MVPRNMEHLETKPVLCKAELLWQMVGRKKKLKGSGNWAFLTKYTTYVQNTHQMILFHGKTQSQEMLLKKGIKKLKELNGGSFLQTKPEGKKKKKKRRLYRAWLADSNQDHRHCNNRSQVGEFECCKQVSY